MSSSSLSPDITLDITADTKNDNYSITITTFKTEKESRRIIPEPDKYCLPFDKTMLGQKMALVNDTIKEIVFLKDENDQLNEYRRGVDIPCGLCYIDLRKIARLNLFEFFFIGEDVKIQKDEGLRFKQKLKELEEEKEGDPLSIWIIPKEFQFPWALVYEKETPDWNDLIDMDSFWGFRHIIVQPNMPHPNNYTIQLSGARFSFNANTDINPDLEPTIANFYKDQPYKGPINEQEGFLDKKDYPYLFVKRDQKKQVLDFLKDDPFDSLIYFYCHAKYEPFDFKPSEKSYIKMASQKGTTNRFASRGEDAYNITVTDLKRIKLRSNHFINQPLIFINACETGVISSLYFNNNFMPFFINRGASGFIGTLTEIPLIFASKFAIKFFEMLFAGEEIDVIIWKLRKKFLKDHYNLLGLFYNSYCSPGLHTQCISKS